MSRSDLRVDHLSCSRGAVTGTTSGDRRIVVIGPVPPPVTGRTLVTACLLEELTRSGIPCSLVNTAVDPAGSSLRRKVRRAVRLALYTLRVLREVRSSTTAYIAVDASPGTVFTALHVLAARLRGCRIVLHHHSYSYVERSLGAMRWLCRMAGRDALHVTPCPVMSAALSTRYAGIERTADLSNAFAIDSGLASVSRPPERDRLVLGHLCNLAAAKGTLTVIDCFAELRRSGEPVELHLAGPIREKAVADAIRRTTLLFGGALHYCGELDARRKRAYYAGIDVFLFPTTFRHEVQPLVVLEALAAGVSVIAYGRACIPPLLEEGAGLAVPREHDFKTAAVQQLISWRRDRTAFAASSNAARRGFAKFQKQSRSELLKLVELFESDQQTKTQGMLPLQSGTSAHAHVGPGSTQLNGTYFSGCQRIFFVGPLSPPITGRTVATIELVRELAKRGVPVRLLNTAPLWTFASSVKRLSRAIRSIKACLALAVCSGVHRAYVSVDADSGMYLTILLAFSCRMRQAMLVLHHHNYSYIARKTSRMSLLARAAGPNAVHLNVCQAMADEMKSRYPAVRRTLPLSNAMSVATMKPVARAATSSLVLGHLSNLSFDKGIAIVINCLRQLRRDGIDAKLVVAGPPAQQGVAELLQQASREFQGAFTHLGALYDHEKQAFYRQIDVFLFPTRYRNETQGIVNLEAMAAGVPVIAYGQCCIPSDLEDSGGLAVPCDAEFESVAVPQLARWARDRDLLRCASAASRRRFQHLRLAAGRELDALTELLQGDAIVGLRSGPGGAAAGQGSDVRHAGS